MKRPLCYNNCGRAARRKSLFCTTKCAAQWGEAIAQGNRDVWCETCGEWGSEGNHDDDHETVEWVTPEDGVA